MAKVEYPPKSLFIAQWGVLKLKYFIGYEEIRNLSGKLLCQHAIIQKQAHVPDKTHTLAVFMKPATVPTHLPDPIRDIRLIGRVGKRGCGGKEGLLFS